MKLSAEAIALIRDAVQLRIAQINNRAEAHEINGNARVAKELRRQIASLQSALADFNEQIKSFSYR